jgi:glutamate-ammonia-ligase adenylyltransferase
MDKIILGELGIYNSLYKIFKDEKIIKVYADEIIHCLKQLPRKKTILINLSRLLEITQPRIIEKLFSSPKFLFVILNLFGLSDWIAKLIIKEPEIILWLNEKWTKEFLTNKEDLTEELARYISIHRAQSFADAIIEFRKREFIRIAALDFVISTEFNECVSQLSLLADVIIETIYINKWNSLVKDYGIPQYYDEFGAVCQAEMAIIGLGKLGSNELNYNSDIDLMFLYSYDGETSGGDIGVISNKEFFTKLAKEIIEFLNQETETGCLYKVDLDLRPDGKSGDIVTSLPQALYYYQTWAQIWEQLALLRARLITGSPIIFNMFINKINSILSSLAGNQNIFNKILELKFKTEQELKKHGLLNNDLKLGKGGIRDIELIAQSLFLFYYNDFYFSENANTLKLIHLLTSKRYLTQTEQALLDSAYISLRKCEHLLQIMSGRHIHSIPDNKDMQIQLSEILSYILNINTSKFSSAIDYIFYLQNEVRYLFEKIFNQHKQVKLDENIEIEELIFVTPINIAKLIKALHYLNVSEPEFYLADFKNIIHKINNLPAKYFFNMEIRRLLINLFVEITKHKNSKIGLKNYDLFIFALKDKSYILDWLLNNRNILSLLSLIFCTSEIASTIIWNNPELITKIVPNLDSLYKDTNFIETQDEELFMENLRILKKIAFLSISISETTGSYNRIYIQNMLSQFARFLIEITMKKLSYDIFKSSHEMPLLVFSLGRLSLNEFDYTSDLDLIWIENPEIINTEEKRLLCFQLIQQFIKIFTMITAEGFLFKIDNRLKPGGYEGQLSVSMNYMLDYLLNSAKAWELLSFCKLSFITGKKEIATNFLNKSMNIIKHRLLQNKLANEIIDLRKKFKTNYHKDHIKYGDACLLDINLFLQYLQIKNNISPAIEKGTIGIMRELYDAKCLCKNDYETLLHLWNTLEDIVHLARVSNQDILLSKPLDNIINSLHLSEQHSIEKINKLREEVINSITQIYSNDARQ